MQRDISVFLRKWKNSKVRQPLLIRGARQTGKTYSVRQFGKANFENCVEINFEEKPEFGQCFDNYDPKSIIEKISILSNESINPGKTLLFLDEIQDYPSVISSLRYFYEKMPGLHVIGAGSLIEFALKSENFKMPVGRIQSIYMYPLSFGEFLDALNQSKLREYINTINLSDKFESIFEDKLIELLRLYFILGGMPKIVDSYVNSVEMNEIMHLQTGLLKTYEDDFAKYSKTSNHKYLREVFLSAPAMVGKRYKYSQVNNDIQSRYLKEALNLLCDTMCISKIVHTAANGVPLEAETNDNKFKILHLDIGLMQRALRLEHSILTNNNLMQVNTGSIAEQYVGQELIATENRYEKNRLFFWVRDAKSSNAEIDYITVVKNIPVPIEVKAGKTGSLKSMRLFLKEHPNTSFGIRFSLHEFSFHDQILSIPLFMVDQLKRLSEPFV